MNEFGLSIARSGYQGYNYKHKFGSNPSLNNTTKESIWSAGGLYPWGDLTSADTVFIVSSSASDTAQLVLEGLDANYLPHVETITLTGTSPVESTSEFIRLDRAYYNDGANVGNITASFGATDGPTINYIAAGDNQTLLGIYTVPADKVGYLIGYTASVGKNDDAEVDLYIRQGGTSSFLIASEVRIAETTHHQDFCVPLKLAPKTDIDFRAIASNTGSKCIVSFDVILERL